eukprot:2809449-Alexandrium_andersonii.AAC.1
MMCHTLTRTPLSWRTRDSGSNGPGRRWPVPPPAGASASAAAFISCGSAGARMRKLPSRPRECWIAKGGKLPKAPVLSAPRLARP